MKKIGILIFVAAIICQAYAQGKTIAGEESKEKSTTSAAGDHIKVIIGKDLISVEDSDSSLKIMVRNRGVSILESLEGPRVKIEKPDAPVQSDYESTHRYQDYGEKQRSRGARSFRGHWSGMEFGLGNYTYLRSMELPDDISYMSLITGKSHTFNFNISQLSMGLSRHLGLVTGIGLNWNCYRFEGNNSITVGPDRVITELVPPDESYIKKSKFSTLYLNVPALVELQIPAGYSNRLNIAAGVIGGIKLNAATRIIFQDKETLKTNGDFNLNLLRAGVTARVGYHNFMLFGTYYVTPWFRELKGPNGYNPEPFELGIAFTFND
ncbi:MAG TPA: hypothetical protein VK861_07030 [Bacteroidales bacterium]|nr:hypothetical protein [Bacteroidales bacterium]